MENIAVVILNWNGKKLLEEFLPSVIKYSPEAVIYVADNASTDDSVAFIQATYPQIKIIINQDNYGYAKGYNEALKHVDEDIYVLLNSDVEVTPNWLNPIFEIFDNEPETAIVQPKILDFYKRDHFEYAGAAGGFIDRYGFPYCRGRIFETIEQDNSQYNDSPEIFWASGACFFIRREVFIELNGFDEDFFAHQEEIDLCWRAYNKNYKAKACGASHIYHVGGATLKNTNPKKTFLNFRNSLWMISKNIPSHMLFPILFTRLCFDGLAGIKFLLEGKFAHIGAIFKAHYHFYANLFKFLNKRESKQYKNYYKTRSMVYNYFILSKKNFNNSL